MPEATARKIPAKAPLALRETSGQIPLFAEMPVARVKSVPTDPVRTTAPVGTHINAEGIEELHELIMAQYDMALYERRIFLKVLELLPETIVQTAPTPANPHGNGLTWVFEPLIVDAKEIIAESDLKGESAFEELKKATKNLIRHVCHIAEADGVLQVGLLASAKYLRGKGKIRIHIDPALHPYLLKVRAHFSLENLKSLIKFRSYYTQCFYEWFEKVKATGKPRVISISLDALRQMLGVEPTEYERYYDFKRFVIGQAQKELQGTELAFEFKEKRCARKVVGLMFYLSWSNLPQTDQRAA